jgi:hypothetical protein
MAAQRGVGKLASNSRLAADALEAERVRRGLLASGIPDYLLPYGTPQITGR